MLGDSVRRRQRPGRTARERPAGTGSFSWKLWFLALPLAATLPFAVGWLIAVYVMFPPAEASGDGIPVPVLIGGSAEDAQRSLALVGLGALQIDRIPNPSVPEGQITAQDPLPGQQLRPDAGVRVAVSAGPPRVVVPDVTGFQADRAMLLLRRLGFDPIPHSQQSGVAANLVLRTDPQAGSARTVPTTIDVFVSVGSPPVLATDTLPDTLLIRTDTLESQRDTLR